MLSNLVSKKMLALGLIFTGLLYAGHRPDFEIQRQSFFDDVEFSSPSSMDHHPLGLIFLDYADKMIYCYSLSGEKLFEFGGEGSGPGEFTRPICVRANRDRIFVYDLGNRFLSEFDSKGGFLKRSRVLRACVNFSLHEDKIIYAYFHKEGLADIEIKDKSGNLVKSIFLKNVDAETYYCTMVAHDGFIYAAPLNKYNIEVYDMNGKYIREFKRNHEAMPPVFFPPTEMNIRTVPVSGISFYRDYVLVLHGGHQHNYESLSKKKLDSEYLMRVDVFDKDGKFIDFFWDDQLPRKMHDIHYKPLFLVDLNEKLWLQDPEDFRLVRPYKIKIKE